MSNTSIEALKQQEALKIRALSDASKQMDALVSGLNDEQSALIERYQSSKDKAALKEGYLATDFNGIKASVDQQIALAKSAKPLSEEREAALGKVIDGLNSLVRLAGEVEHRNQSNGKRIFEWGEVPYKIGDHTYTKEERTALAFGRQTPLIENVTKKDGEKMSFKARLSRDPDGQVRQLLRFKYPKLKIPNIIAGYELSAEEKDAIKKEYRLLKGLEGVNGKFDAYVKVDKDLNAIVIKSDYEIGLKREIGGIRLTDEQMEQIVNAGLDEKAKGPRIEGINGKYGRFDANLKIDPEKRVITWSDVVMEKDRSRTKVSKIAEKLSTTTSKEASKKSSTGKAQTKKSNQRKIKPSKTPKMLK